MAPRIRKLEIGLAVFGLLTGFGLTLAGIVAARGSHHGAATPATSKSAVIDSGLGGASSPAALDAQWAAYSDQSTCADWAGGDGVSAVRLSSAQLAWFFSDTFLGPAGPSIGFSHASGFVHNSVVVQTSSGQRSRFVTLTGGGACSKPGESSQAAIPVISGPIQAGQEGDRYWDADGLRIGRAVIKFFNRYLPGSPPFVPVGTVIAQFSAGQLAAAGRGPGYGAVARPRVTVLPSYVPPAGGSPIVWGSALLRVANTVYIYGYQSPDPAAPRQLYLARVSASKLADFAAWQFYAGEGQWAAGQEGAQPVQPGSGLSVAAGFSVVQLGGRYWLIQQAVQVGNPDIDAFPAPAPWGPFDAAAGVLLYRSPDIGLDAAHDYRIMYEARAEPALSTRQTLVLSYNVNSPAINVGCVPMSAYTNTLTLPRFVAVPRAAFTAADPQTLGRLRVVAGPSQYRSIAAKNPSQWFNGWNYHGGCPSVPPVRAVAARQSGNSIVLQWPRAGIGLHYQVYVRAVGGAYSPASLVRSLSATLTGLSSGVTYQVLVVAVNIKQQQGQGATATFTVR